MKSEIRVFVVQHTRVKANGIDESVKLIGIFSTRELADNAVVMLSSKPGFVDTKDGFHVDELTMDRASWQSGFGIPDNG